jgi:hypothetical protein
MFLILFIIIAPSIYPLSEIDSLKANGKKYIKTDTLPLQVNQVKSELLKIDRLELIGKLMTTFLKEKKKAYKIQKIEDSLFSIKSRKTIREGSTLRVMRMDGDKIVFFSRMVLKKLFTFNCNAFFETCYFDNDSSVICSIRVIYDAPAVLKGIDKGIEFFTRKSFVARKTSGFLERLNFLMQELDSLTKEEWIRIANDRSYLSSLIYPVTFTQEEIEFVGGLIGY